MFLTSGFFSLWGEKPRVIKGRDLLSEYRHSPYINDSLFSKVCLSVVVHNFEFLALRRNVENYG